MNNISFIQDLAVVMVAAGIAAFVCQWLKQPKIIGYVIAGLIIGPHTPPFSFVVSDMSIHALADIGVIFLMFCMGFDFNLRRLTSVGLSAFIIACIDVTFTFWLGFMAGRVLGWGALESLFLGAIICDSSTTIVLQVLNELGHLKSRYAALIMGSTIIEDLVAIVLIAFLSGIGATGSVQAGDIVLRIGELLAFMVVTLLAGFFLLRPIINYISKYKNDELLLMIALATCFAVSLIAVKLEFSLALGAFIVGAVIAESHSADRIAFFSQPIRDIFAPMFFISIGMLVDPLMIFRNIWVIILITGIVIFGKITASSFSAFISGNDRETSFRVGLGMAQICEFALIIAALGRSLNITSDSVYSISVTVSVATMVINPHMLRNADVLYRIVDRLTPARIGGAMTAYVNWLQNVSPHRMADPVRKIIRRSLITIAVNLVLITTVFITVKVLSRYEAKMPFQVPDYLGGTSAILWLCGALLTIPLYVATIRKWQAISMVAAEMRFPVDSGISRNAIARTLSEKFIMFAGITLLAFYTLMLSSALFPSFHVLIIMLVIIGIITALLWKFQIKLYSKAQNLVIETFTGPSTPLYVEPLTALPYLFREAKLSSVEILRDSPVAMQTVQQLGIRSRTGATIIGIRRGEDMITNPALEEVLAPGDKVLLLGLQDQLDGAKSLLDGTLK
ncbi:MAG: cation:proton antiporter [Kiritimatiellae bacterium]|nr:cation:proton antiporter [Kiritimatiellia bacterium]MDD5520186.1 cation:proton antiporter [Kiritimatiellia bacterium]